MTVKLEKCIAPAQPGCRCAAWTSKRRRAGLDRAEASFITASFSAKQYAATSATTASPDNPLLERLAARQVAQRANGRHLRGPSNPRSSTCSEGRPPGLPVDMEEAAKPYLNCLIRRRSPCSALQTYFTAGVKEVRAWTIPIGATAPQAVGVHTDFERGFIRAQTILRRLHRLQGRAGRQGSRQDARRRQGIRGQDGDVMNFLFNV